MYAVTFEIFNIRTGTPLVQSIYGSGGLTEDESIAISSNLNASFELHGKSHIPLEADEAIQYDFQPMQATGAGLRDRLNALLSK